MYVFLPAAAMASWVDAKALPRSSPSPEPMTVLSDLVDSAKNRPPSLEKSSRSHSLPPWTFLPLAGTMNGSPPPATMPWNGILSPGSDGVGAMTMLKSGGIQTFPAFEQVAAVGELVESLENFRDGRGLPSVRFQIFDVAQSVRIVLPEHL